MNLEEIKLAFSTNELNGINNLNLNQTKKVLLELLSEYSSDKNSSSFREGVTLGILGKKQSKKKLGYDSEDECLEVKPKNIMFNSKNKFDGSGNFSDFTWARHKKYSTDDVKMIVSGFLDGKLIFVLSFKYNSADFIFEIEKQLKKHLPYGDIKNRYVRSIKFSYKHFINSESCNIEYLNPIISEIENKFTKPFYGFIFKK
jgi:hypothetical protein